MPTRHSTKPARSLATRQAGKLPRSRATPGLRNREWLRRLKELAAFKKKHGHCSVPSRESSNLSQWAGRQRVAKRTGKLSAERVRRLDELGFPWDAQDQLAQLEQATWESMYNALAAYRRRHGHSEVPSEESVGLSRWVRMQRVAKRTGRLSAERIR